MIKTSIAEKIKRIARYRGITIDELARGIGCTKQNLYLKMKRGNWKEGELEAYAEALGCEVEVVFTDKATGERLM